MSHGLELDCEVQVHGFTVRASVQTAGRALGVFGPSGAGKSTWLAGLAGLVKARRARVLVGGEALVDSDIGVVPPVHRRGVGVVFQDHRLFPHMDVASNLRYGSKRRGGGKAQPALGLDDVVELLELGELLARRPAALSGGERQRVALGRALLAQPRLLLLDEPLASLDRGRRGAILPFLRAAVNRFQLPLVYVSHELDELLSLDGDILLLDGGRQVACGPINELSMQEGCLELLHDCGLLFQLAGRIAPDTTGGLVWIELEGGGRVASGAFEGPGPPRAGSAAEVLLRPEDIILALPPFEAEVSLTNGLPCTVERIARTPARTLVEARVDGGSARLLAEVTERAVQRLGIEAGQRVVALFKAQATRCRSGVT